MTLGEGGLSRAPIFNYVIYDKKMSYISEIYIQNSHENQWMSFDIEQKGKSVTNYC